MLNLDRIIKRNPTAAWRILEGHLIVVTPEDTMVHRCNQTGTFIWEALGEKSHRLEALVPKISEEFTVSEARAGRDLMDFVERGLKKDIFVLCPPP
jgi:hypothetical protein